MNIWQWRTYSETKVCLHNGWRRSSNLVWTGGRTFGLREGGFSYCTIAARVQWSNSIVMTTRRGPMSTEQLQKLAVGNCKFRHLFHMEVNDCTATSIQLSTHWSTATGVLMSASSIRGSLLHRGLRARVPLYRILLMTNHRRLRLQWAHEQRAW